MSDYTCGKIVKHINVILTHLAELSIKQLFLSYKAALDILFLGIPICFFFPQSPVYTEYKLSLKSDAGCSYCYLNIIRRSYHLFISGDTL